MAIKERWKGFAALPAEITETLGCLVPLFEQEDVLLAYLFGSLGTDREANDIDLAILTRDKPAYCLREQIVECLGTERVDLVDLERASPVLRFEILKTGRPLYVADEELNERFELETLHLYRDTRFMRRRQEEYLRERMAQWSSNEKPS